MEYFLLIIEYFKVKGFKSLIGHFVIPAIFGFLIYFEADSLAYIKNAARYQTSIITVLGILMGFTISTFTMLLTINNSNVEKAKAKSIGKKLYNKNLSLFDSVLIGLAYIILLQGMLLIANFIYPIFIPSGGNYDKIFFSANVSLVIHVILVLMKNILNFYFIVTKQG